MDFIAMRILRLKQYPIVDIRIEMNRRCDNELSSFPFTFWQSPYYRQHGICRDTYIFFLCLEKGLQAKQSVFRSICCMSLHSLCFVFYCFPLRYRYRFVPCCFRILFSVLFDDKKYSVSLFHSLQLCIRKKIFKTLFSNDNKLTTRHAEWKGKDVIFCDARANVTCNRVWKKAKKREKVDNFYEQEHSQAFR